MMCFNVFSELLLASSDMSAAAGQKDARTNTHAEFAGVRKPVKTTKPYDSYLLRYQELKLMKEGINHRKNQQNLQHNEHDIYTLDRTNEEVPQIDEELDSEKASKRGCKTKLCAVL
ncbi:hypothetical protein WMY93_005305 [Mugilogobius chulae]|uniref:Secreted protein n=1 Tax=Mugilogobius chulae TaxID=88201 RepID=A0AAW0PTA6_9GOBI